jgi:hypothetical protein
VASPHSIPCDVYTVVKAHLEESVIKGNFEANLKLGIMNNIIPMNIRGNLEAQVV